MKNWQKIGGEAPVQGALDFDGDHARPQVVEKGLYLAFRNPAIQPKDNASSRETSAIDILIAHAKSLSW